MRRKITLKKSLEVYVRKQTQNAIQHTLTGLGISTLLIHGIHIFDFSHQGNFVAVLCTIVIGLIPVFVDSIFFYIKQMSEVEAKLNQLDDAVKSVFHNQNDLMKNSVLSRLDKEIEIICKMPKNNLELPALQNFEYIREILGRVIQKVMEPNDKYITLSRLDFWTATPNEYLDFIRVNGQAVHNSSKLIDRIIVLKKELLNKQSPTTSLTDEQLGLIELIKNFSKTTNHDYNYYSNLKTLFYFTNDYETLEEFLLSAIVIKNNSRDLMFVQVKKLENIEKKNPKILIKYYTLESWNPLAEIKADTVKTINSLINYITEQFSKGDNSAELSNLLQYLRVYKKCFDKLSTIYDISGGLRLSTIDLTKCELFDIKMASEHYNINLDGY